VVQAGFETHPAIGVSWLGAQAYVRWLSEKTGRKYRLPTEAEWEYAARAGEKNAVYAIETLKDVCRIGNVPDLTRRKAHPNWGAYPCEDGFAEAAPAGRFEPNRFGLYDTLGNAWEWVQDCWHSSYDGAPRDGSAWTTDADCQLRVLRGNSYENFSDFGLAARVFTTSLRLSRFNGFRVVRDLSEP
jgi:formylglycine-generating enzyme required for sulfatase activity